MRTSKIRWTILTLSWLMAAGASVGQEPKLDRYGDPLPERAIARLGTNRLRHSDPVSHMAFHADSRVLVTVGDDGVICQWNAVTGKNVSRVVLSQDRSVDPVGRGSAAAGPNWGMSHRGGSMLSTVLSGDGKVLAVCGDGNAIRILDSATGRKICKIDNPKDGIGAMILSRDGGRLAHASGSSIEVWDTAGGKGLFSEKRERDEKRDERSGPGSGTWSSLAYSPDGKILAKVEVKPNQGKDDKPGDGRPTYRARLSLHDAETGRTLGPAFPAKIIRSSQSSANFSPDGKQLAWVHDRSIHLLDVASGKEDQAFQVAEADDGWIMLFAPDSRKLLTRGYADRMLRVWDASTGKKLRQYGIPMRPSSHWTRVGSDSRLAMAVSPDGKRVALAEGNVVRLLDLDSGEEAPVVGHTLPVLLVQHAADGKTLTSWGVDGTIRVWDTATGNALRQSNVVKAGEYFAMSPDGNTLAVALDETTISIRDAATGKERVSCQGPRNTFGTFAFSPDGKTLAVQGLVDTSLRLALFDVATGRVRHDIPVPVAPPVDGNIVLPSSDVAGLTFTPDGQTVAMLVNCHTLGLWDAATGHERLRLAALETRPIQGVTFSRDGRSFVLDLGTGLLSVRETANGKERRSLQAKSELPGGPLISSNTLFAQFGSTSPIVLHSTRPAASAAFSRDGRLLAQSRADGAIAVWDIAAKKELTPLKGHQGYVTTLAFSPDGKTLASGSRDTTVLIWDVTDYAANVKASQVNVDAAARWQELLDEDAAKAFDAITALAAAPNKAVPYLKAHAHPALSDAAAIMRLIAELDSDQFPVRQRASKELAQQGEAAVPFIRDALGGQPSPEASRRLKSLLAREPWHVQTGDALRLLRAIEVLEMIGTPEAKTVLQALTQGAPDATAPRAARSALERLER